MAEPSQVARIGCPERARDWGLGSVRFGGGGEHRNKD